MMPDAVGHVPEMVPFSPLSKENASAKDHIKSAWSESSWPMAPRQKPVVFAPTSTTVASPRLISKFATPR